MTPEERAILKEEIRDLAGIEIKNILMGNPTKGIKSADVIAGLRYVDGLGSKGEEQAGHNPYDVTAPDAEDARQEGGEVPKVDLDAYDDAMRGT